MRAVLLAPGPSLARLGSIPRCDLSIAINRAAIRFPVSVWACLDLPLIAATHDDVMGSPTLVVGTEAFDNLRDRGIVWRGERFDPKQLEVYCPNEWIENGQQHRRGWPMYSATTALIYAGYRGATRIDVYGADWSGTLDYDGVEAGKSRGPERWIDEANIWNRQLAPWLGERGVEVVRHTL